MFFYNLVEPCSRSEFSSNDSWKMDSQLLSASSLCSLNWLFLGSLRGVRISFHIYLTTGIHFLFLCLLAVSRGGVKNVLWFSFSCVWQVVISFEKWWLLISQLHFSLWFLFLCLLCRENISHQWPHPTKRANVRRVSLRGAVCFSLILTFFVLT